MLYLVLMVSWEPGNLIWMSISIIAVSWMPAARDVALPLRCRAAIGPGSSGVASAGCLIQPAPRGAHHPQVFRVFTVIHPPTIVFAVLQGLLRAVTTYIIHPYWALWKDKQLITSFIVIFIDCSVYRLGNASTQGPESVPKHLTLDFYWHTDLGLHLSGMFSGRYTVFYKAGCCRSCSLNPFNLLFNLDLKAAVKNVHKPQQVLHNSGKWMLSLL